MMVNLFKFGNVTNKLFGCNGTSQFSNANPEIFTGHCFKCTRATLPLNRLGGWKSSFAAEG